MTTISRAIGTEHISADRFAKLILDLGEILIGSGAHCGRINRNIQRLGERWGFHIDLFISFRAISVTVTDRNNPSNKTTSNRQSVANGVHFGKLTKISLLTWEVLESNLSIEKTEECLKTIRETDNHPIWLIRLGIGLACGSLCMLAGGNHINALIAFMAAICGLIIRQEIVKRNFNHMISIFLAAFTTTLISGIDMYFNLGAAPETTVATAVLYLIPGVPLINCVIDLFEGYIPTAIARGTFGGFVLLCIAVGMSLSITLIGINNF